MNRKPFVFALTALALAPAIAMYAFVGTTGASATPTAIGTVVGIEKHTNPVGDRWVTIQPQQPAFGIWVTEACATSLALGDDWPSANSECQ